MEPTWSTLYAAPSSTPCASPCANASAPKWTFAAAPTASRSAAAGPASIERSAVGFALGAARSSSAAQGPGASPSPPRGRARRAATGSPSWCSTRWGRACRTPGSSRRTRGLRSGPSAWKGRRSGRRWTSRFAPARSAWRCSSSLRARRAGSGSASLESLEIAALAWCSRSRLAPGLRRGRWTTASTSTPGSSAGWTARSARCRERDRWR